MKHMKQTVLISSLLAVLGVGVAQAYSTDAKTNDAATAMQSANPSISLSQAIATAEQNIGGKATKAELEHSQGQWAYDVEVLNASGKTFDVAVNSNTGAIISAAEDTNDHDDEKGDKNDNGGDGQKK